MTFSSQNLVSVKIICCFAEVDQAGKEKETRSPKLEKGKRPKVRREDIGGRKN